MLNLIQIHVFTNCCYFLLLISVLCVLSHVLVRNIYLTLTL